MANISRLSQKLSKTIEISSSSFLFEMLANRNFYEAHYNVFSNANFQQSDIVDIWLKIHWPFAIRKDIQEVSHGKECYQS